MARASLHARLRKPRVASAEPRRTPPAAASGTSARILPRADPGVSVPPTPRGRSFFRGVEPQLGRLPARLVAQQQERPLGGVEGRDDRARGAEGRRLRRHRLGRPHVPPLDAVARPGHDDEAHVDVGVAAVAHDRGKRVLDGVVPAGAGPPVSITKNGKGDLAVLSIEAYEQLLGRFELYGLLQEGMDDIETGNTRPVSEALSDIRARRKR